jgi:large subunit ribosomal protein L9
MPKTVELLLVESVENVGIVGDVVKVRTGYARNFLLPRELATVPSEELIKSLQSKRAAAEKEAAELRVQRSATISKLDGYELELVRPCNDLGILYGAVTQQEISAALQKAGFSVRPRDVRLSGAIKRVDHYDVHIKYETELETYIKLNVKPDRVLAKDEKPEMDLDAKGRPIMVRPGDRKEEGEGEGKGEKGAEKKGDKKPKAEAAVAEAKPEKKAEATAEEEAPKKAAKKPREDVKKASAAKK